MEGTSQYMSASLFSKEEVRVSQPHPREDYDTSSRADTSPNCLT